MSRKMFGIVLLLVLSVCLGLFTGERFYRLFLSAVPHASQSDLSVTTAHGAFLGYGFVLGIVLCAWGFGAAVLARFFQESR